MEGRHTRALVQDMVKAKLITKESENNAVQLKDKTITIQRKNSTDSDLLLNIFLTDLLYSNLVKIYDQMKKRRGVEVLGDLDFEVVHKIDNKGERIAKFKGNKITVKSDMIRFPKLVLQYIVAHEVTHIAHKRHTKRFWKTVNHLCPKYENAQMILSKYEGPLKHASS